MREDVVETQVIEALAEAGLTRSDEVVVACSGGPDSTALAGAVAAAVRAGRLGGAVLVHVDHRLRDGSAADGDHVRRLADIERLGFARTSVEVDRRGASLEAAAREARYQALDQAADELGSAAILTGHTASDQAETVLMRAVRGTGVAGLAGIPRRRGRYLRPLLGVSRGALARYLAARGVAALEDPTNADPAFTRNRFRHRWLPALAEENPRVEDALCRLADAAAEQRQVLEYAAAAVLDRARGPDGELAVAPLAAAPDAVAKRALARAVEPIGSGPLARGHIDDLLALARRPEAGSVALDLPGLRAVREYDRIVLGPPAEPEAAPEVDVLGGRGPYTVRRWRPGDRMRPARLGGRSRKLSDLFVDAKVPRRLRTRAIVLSRREDGTIDWAEHVGRAHGVEIEVTLTPPRRVTSNKG